MKDADSQSAESFASADAHSPNSIPPEEVKTRELSGNLSNETLQENAPITEVGTSSQKRKYGRIQEEDDDDEPDASPGAFELLSKRARKKKKKKANCNNKIISLQISVQSDSKKDPGHANQSKQDVSPMESQVSNPPPSSTLMPSRYSLIPDDMEEEEDPLAFFAETHEEQDPAYMEFYSVKLKERREKAFAQLEEERKEDMAKIEKFLEAKWEERSGTLQTQIKKAKSTMLLKQKKQRTQLAERHRRQLESDEKKVEEGIKWLTQRQRVELERRMQQHQQEAQRIGLTQEQSMMEWNKVSIQLQTRHSHQHQQFDAKKVDMNKKSEQELKAQTGILEAHHKKRQAEMDQYSDDMSKKYRTQQDNLRSKLFKLHQERFEKKRELIESDRSNRANDILNPVQRDAQKHSLTKYESPVDPGKNTQDSHPGLKAGAHEGSASHNAVVRQKRRKHVMNGATIQLAVEIHNEGVIVMTRSSHHDGDKQGHDDVLHSPNNAPDKPSGRKCSFIPWSNKARSFLYSIFCGEVPSDYGVGLIDCSAGHGVLDGGLVKCMVTDTRTGEETAMCERGEALKKVEGEKFLSHSISHIQECEKAFNHGE